MKTTTEELRETAALLVTILNDEEGRGMMTWKVAVCNLISRMAQEVGLIVEEKREVPAAMKAPNPIDEVLRWCRRNRPDDAVHIERLMEMESGGNDVALATILLMCLGFAAGRKFQHDDPANTALLR